MSTLDLSFDQEELLQEKIEEALEKAMVNVISNLMESLSCSADKAMELLKLPPEHRVCYAADIALRDQIPDDPYIAGDPLADLIRKYARANFERRKHPSLPPLWHLLEQEILFQEEVEDARQIGRARGRASARAELEGKAGDQNAVNLYAISYLMEFKSCDAEWAMELLKIPQDQWDDYAEQIEQLKERAQLKS